jgi:hypothetical protein
MAGDASDPVQIQVTCLSLSRVAYTVDKICYICEMISPKIKRLQGNLDRSNNTSGCRSRSRSIEVTGRVSGCRSRSVKSTGRIHGPPTLLTGRSGAVWKHHFLKDIYQKTQPYRSQLHMAPKGIKASKVIQRKSKAKVIEWVTENRSRGTRNIPVEVSISRNLPKPRRDAGRMETNDYEAIFHETDPASMDVDETFWTEEPVIPEKKRVRLPIIP